MEEHVIRVKGQLILFEGQVEGQLILVEGQVEGQLILHLVDRQLMLVEGELLMVEGQLMLVAGQLMLVEGQLILVDLMDGISLLYMPLLHVSVRKPLVPVLSDPVEAQPNH